MTPLQRATSGFHAHGFGTEQRPNKPTHAAVVGARYAICGASVQHLFLRRWGQAGPDTGGCSACQTENLRLLAEPEVISLDALRLVP
ncbi:MAG: hypothetical protein QOI76_1600 [Frankiales bacterium]|jgi:hypothetical protein|nr:hypothetical protein [Frankiales bacterium]